MHVLEILRPNQSQHALKVDLVEIVEAVIVNVQIVSIFLGKMRQVFVLFQPPKAIQKALQKVIRLLDQKKIDDISVKVFHSGTKRNEAGDFVTNGGRVLGVTAIDEDIEGAISRAYQAVEKISFDGMQYRSDIGARAIARRK